jgi:carbamoyl-phosphate synthase large subunit
LAHNKEVIESTGARLAVVSYEAATTVEDKWLTSLFFQKIGLPIPRSWLPGELDPEQVEYPLFVKPRRGSAGKHSFKVHNARELKFFLDYVPNTIIQEYLSGLEITSDVVCDRDGVLLAIVSRQRIEVRWGEVAKGVTVHDPVITDACVKIAKALPAIGPITVQCIMKRGIPHFTEINARLGGGIPLGIAAGVDSPKWLLARAAGIKIEIPPIGTYKTGLYMTRYDDSFFMSEVEHEQMASRRFRP